MYLFRSLQIFDKCGYILQAVEGSLESETSNSEPRLKSISNRDQLHINVKDLSLCIKIDIKDIKIASDNSWLVAWYSVNHCNEDVCLADIGGPKLLTNHSLCLPGISTIADRQYWEELDRSNHLHNDSVRAIGPVSASLPHQPSNMANVSDVNKHVSTNNWPSYDTEIVIAFIALVVILKTVIYSSNRGQPYQESTLFIIGLVTHVLSI